MDEERRLVIELQSKLAELDHKVWLYRREMVAEFEKHVEGTLTAAPKEISDKVAQALAVSMKDYTSLYPTPADACESGSALAGISTRNEVSSDLDLNSPTNNSTTTPAFTSPIPIAFRPSFPSQMDEDLQPPRSPHEREKEFQGVFTPSYLPLLGDYSSERRASHAQRLSSQPSAPPVNQLRRTEISVNAGTETRSLVVTLELDRPPIPKRKNTDEVSVASDASEGTIRRSALRRSSGSSVKQSPRRVRFEFDGIEVSPTSSPLRTSYVQAEGLYDSEEEVGLEQIEDVEQEDSPPPPKRISSSQALRELSRRPLEEGDSTTWTTVSAPDDGSPSVPTVAGASDKSISDGNEAAGEQKLKALGGNPIPTEGPSKAADHVTVKRVAFTKLDDDSGELSDDDILDMPALKSTKGRKALPPASILSPLNTIPIEGSSVAKSPTRASRPSWENMDSLGDEAIEKIGRGMRFGEDDHEELFDFDENTTQQRSPPEILQDDSESDDSDHTEPATSPTARNTLSDFSRSPARPIQPAVFQRPSQPSDTLVGSFKHHPFSMPIVSDAIHAQAASMGAISSFVGSVTGRSGFDESNVASYRASGGMSSFSGEPKSLAERMMMEDMEEAAKNKN